jgi:hypothetical protein
VSESILLYLKKEINKKSKNLRWAGHVAHTRDMRNIDNTIDYIGF